MVYFYSGTPGSGKSYHVAEDIRKALMRGKYVFSNFPVNLELVPPDRRGFFIHLDNAELRISSFRHYIKYPRKIADFSYLSGFVGFAQQFLNRNSKGQIIERQALIVLDEAQELFNPREWNRNDRLAWIEFFRLHRHIGYDIIVVSQDNVAIDKQIRGIFQTEVLHKNLRNYNSFAWFLSLIFGGNFFVRIYRNYAQRIRKDSVIKKELRKPKKKIYDFYDTTMLF